MVGGAQRQRGGVNSRRRIEDFIRGRVLWLYVPAADKRGGCRHSQVSACTVFCVRVLIFGYLFCLFDCLFLFVCVCVLVSFLAQYYLVLHITFTTLCSNNCQLGYVQSKMYKLALQEGEKNTHRLVVDGKIVLVTENRSDEVG